MRIIPSINSLSEKFLRSKRYPCACKMNHNKVILSFLFPANNQSSKSIEPRIHPFPTSPTCPKTLYLFYCVFFSTAFDICNRLIFFNQLFDIMKIISLIYAYILNYVIFWRYLSKIIENFDKSLNFFIRI